MTFPRSRLLLLAAGLATFSIAAIGCSSNDSGTSSGDDVVISANALIASSSFERAVAVGMNRLDAPISGNERILDQMTPGRVLVGARSDLPDSKNPEGFLVKVVSVTREGATATITTEPAALNEVIEQGSFGVKATEVGFTAGSPGGGSGVSIKAGGTVGKNVDVVFQPQDLYTFDESVAGLQGAAQVSGKVALKEGHFKFAPQLSYQADIKKAFGFFPTGVSFQAEATGDLDASVAITADIVAAANANLQANYEKILGGQPVTVFVSSPAPLPSVSVGPVTVSSSAQLRIDATCTIKDTGGEAHVEAGVAVLGKAAAGVKYDGSWTSHAEKTITATPTLVYDAKGKADIDCKLEGVLAINLFGSATAEITIGSSVVFQGQGMAMSGQQASGSCFLKAGVEGNFNGKLEILGFKVASKKFQIFDYEFAPAGCSTPQPTSDAGSPPPPPQGDGGAPPPSFCTGVANGSYCGSELGQTPTSYYQCLNDRVSFEDTCKQCQRQGQYAYCIK
jgi:hypothetical protein